MSLSERERMPVLVRGAGDIGSAVAVLLFRAGHPVVLHDVPMPATSRRGMAFTDAVFDGVAVLDGVTGCRIDDLLALQEALAWRETVLVTVAPFSETLRATSFSVLIDARLRKREIPEDQQGLAPCTIGLGPNFVAGENVDLAIETAWGERLGAVIKSGPTLPLAGPPRPLGGVIRERFIYAPVAGRIETVRRIGDRVEAGEVVATIGDVALLAPLNGVVRGLTHSGVTVGLDAKVIEIDVRGDPSAVFGLGERPRRVAEGVCQALADIQEAAD